MGKRAKQPDTSKKIQKFEDAECIPTFTLDRCYVNVQFINYYNPKSLVGHDFKDSNQSVVYLRSHNAVFGDKTPCMYDHHEFTGQKFCIPTKWCSNKKEFQLWGKFCSMECARAYADTASNPHREKELSLIAMLGRKLYGTETRIYKAPSILLLQRYGGPLSIEEFRQEFSSKRLWVIQQIKSSYTHLMYDVYLNNEYFEISKVDKGQPCMKKDAFSLRRKTMPAHQTKRSLMTMLGRKEVDE